MKRVQFKFIAGLMVSMAFLSCVRTQADEPRADDNEKHSSRKLELARVIPADTPYLYLAKHALPDEWVSKLASTTLPTLDTELDALRRELASDGSRMKPLERLIVALAVEFLPRLSQPSSQRAPSDASQSAFALYGLGVAPVLKVRVKEPEELTAAIQNVVKLAALDAVSERIHGAVVWRARFSRFSLIVALKRDLLTLSAASGEPRAEWMQSLIDGPQNVADSIASQLPELRREKGFTGTNIGFFKVKTIGTALLAAGANPIKDSWTGLGLPLLPAAAPCIAEFKRFFALLDRVEFGGVARDDTKLRGRAVATLTPWLAKLIGASLTTAPGHARPTSSTFELSLGLRPGKALRSILSRLQARPPFQCAALQSIERQLLSAGGILGALVARMPAYVQSLDGFHLALWTQTPSKKNAQQDAGLEVLAAVRGDGVAGLVDWVRSLSPAFRESLKSADGRPRLLPLNSRPTYLSEPLYAAWRPKRIGVFSGRRVADAFERLAPAKTDSSERLIVLDYDLARLTSGLRAVAKRIAAFKGIDKPILRDSIEAFLGRFRLVVSLKGEWLIFDTELGVRK